MTGDDLKTITKPSQGLGKRFQLVFNQFTVISTRYITVIRLFLVAHWCCFMVIFDVAKPLRNHPQAVSQSRFITWVYHNILLLVGGLDHFYFSIFWEFHHPNWLKPPTVTNRHQPSPTVTNRHQPSPTVTNRHQPSPTVTNRHQPSPTVTNRHQPSPTVTNRHQPVCSYFSEG